MKYAVVILSGGADEPIEMLDGASPLEAASLPTMDEIARRGRVGLVSAVPEEHPPIASVAMTSLAGLDPRAFRLGAAALCAVGAGVSIGAEERVLKLDLVGVETDQRSKQFGEVVDHAPALTRAEARALLDALLEHWRTEEPDLMRDLALRQTAGAGAILIDRSGRSYEAFSCPAPGELPGRAWDGALPTGEHQEIVRTLIERSFDALDQHEVNRSRRESGFPAANLAWIWGVDAGADAALPPFADRFGLRAAFLAEDEGVRGLGKLIEWDRLAGTAAGGGSEAQIADRLASIGRSAAGALDRYDLVCVHLGAPAEAGLRGDFSGKVAALESIDANVVRPLLAKLDTFGDAESAPPTTPDGETGWRMLVATDFPVISEQRRAARSASPFAMCGGWIRSLLELPFNERGAAGTDLIVDPGHDLMEYFLFSGLRARSRKTMARGKSES